MRIQHRTVRGGILLGLIVGTVLWLWLLIVDAAVGEPLRTFTALGGVVQFTILHYVVCCAFGVGAMAAVHAAARTRSVLYLAALAFVVAETGFAMLSALLVHVGLGELAWLRIMGGAIIGGVLTIVILVKTHPLDAAGGRIV